MSEAHVWTQLFQQWASDHPGWEIRGHRSTLNLAPTGGQEGNGFLVRAINHQTGATIYGVGEVAAAALGDAARQIPAPDGDQYRRMRNGPAHCRPDDLVANA